MFLLLALLAELARIQARMADSEGIFLHVTVPKKIRSDESEVLVSEIGCRGYPQWDVEVTPHTPRPLGAMKNQVKVPADTTVLTVFLLHLRVKADIPGTAVFLTSFSLSDLFTHGLYMEKVIYIITIDKNPYTLHLTKCSFLLQNILVYTFNETGSLHTDSSYFKMHCHYQGYIADFPNSFATPSICSGLR
ncbi:disintegrin and metalloproteinase domain-containing protein 18-like [Molossus nigricans]